MNELAEFNYNLQTESPKMLHGQQYGIYGFHFPPPRSTGVHTAIHTLVPSDIHIVAPHTLHPLSSSFSCLLRGFFN